MNLRSTVARTTAHVLLALLFALAALAFAARAWDAVESAAWLRMSLYALAALGMVSLTTRSLYRARRASGAVS